MADIKTHLRELSVGMFVGLLSKGKKINIIDYYNPSTFFSAASSNITNDISNAKNILTAKEYSTECKSIIKNGYDLALAIYNSKEFNINETTPIYWVGNDTQKGDPIDLIIGNYKFSLKEESFILKNMGLYTLLNNLTGSNYQRGLHVFETFSKLEYDRWFAYTWTQLVSYLQKNKEWSLLRKDKLSKINIINNKVCMNFDGIISSIPLNITTNTQFMTYTNSKTREKVFSKWIDDVLKKDTQYLKLKKECSETAGAKLASKLMNEYKSDNIYDFFQIWPFDYYYAKTTANETTILHVPDQAHFNDVIQFKGCTYEVPQSQLNIITTFKNTTTNKQLQFRNECRFSHGQFNGTPEAKMYVVSDTPLTALYNKIK